MSRSKKYLLLSLIVFVFAIVGFLAFRYFTAEEAPDMTQPQIELTDTVPQSPDSASVVTMDVTELSVCGDEAE